MYTSGLAEAQGSPTHFKHEPDEEGYRGTNSYILVTCRGSSIVEIRRYGPCRLCDIRRLKRSSCLEVDLVPMRFLLLQNSFESNL